MNTPLNAIVFDIGNVLLKLHFQRAHQFFLQQTGLSLRAYRAKSSLSEERILLFEKGMISAEDFYQYFCADMEITIERKIFHKVWNDIFSKNQPMMDYAHSLIKKNFPVYCLSNTNELHYEHFYPTYPIFAQMNGIIASHLVGAAKPEEKIYRVLLERFSLESKTTLFIDDRLENIQAAEELGFQTFHYTFNDQEIQPILDAVLNDS